MAEKNNENIHYLEFVYALLRITMHFLVRDHTLIIVVNP